MTNIEKGTKKLCKILNDSKTCKYIDTDIKNGFIVIQFNNKSYTKYYTIKIT